MARKTFEFTATVKSADGTQDEIAVTLEYPENRAVALLGLIDQLGVETNAMAIKRAVLSNNLNDASILGLIAQAGDLDDNDEDW